MKAAVIYYSLDGNCAVIAEQAASRLKADIFRVRLADTKKRKGFAKMFWGGRMVVMHKKPEIQSLSINIAAYDLIIIGTPVWAASPAPPLMSFLEKTRISGKKIALFCCHAGGRGGALDKLKANLPEGNTFISEIDFINPSKADRKEITEKVNNWIKTLN
ncbi:MAG: NAD(P)H-dependent oxidoreductase [Treponema sp.]|jgi:flavodoxin|nr:NAD(P)H-dependent oxidoreductase [Treponema sp.]